MALSTPVLRTPGIDGTLGPERFADGPMQAAQVATSGPAPEPAWFDPALMSALARRPS